MYQSLSLGYLVAPFYGPYCHRSHEVTQTTQNLHLKEMAFENQGSRLKLRFGIRGYDFFINGRIVTMGVIPG